MRLFSLFIALVLCILCLGSGVFAQDQAVQDPVAALVIPEEPNIDVEAHFDRTHVNVGDELTYTVQFKWVHDSTKYRITPPHIDPVGFDVINVATSSETIKDNNKTFKVRNYAYSLKARLPGEQMVEAHTVNYYVEGYSDPYFVSLPAMSIDVIAVKKPLFTDSRVLIGAGGGVLIIVTLIIVITTMKKKKNLPQAESTRDRILSELDAVQATFDKGEYNQVVDELDACTQSLLFTILGVDKHSALTADALSAVEGFRKLDEKQRATIIKILKQAEEARYSGIRYERHEVRMLLDDFRGIIENIE